MRALLTRAGALVLLAGAAATLVARSQTPPPPPGTGLLAGLTVDGITGKPIAGATVNLMLVPNPTPVAASPGAARPGSQATPFPGARVIVDRDGHFVFRDLPAGTFSLTASKPGYADGAFGRRFAGSLSQTLTLGGGERRGDVTLELWRHATISGTVVDEAGEPVIGLQVRVLRRTIVGGSPSLSSVGISTTPTDDRGMYRVSAVTPGEYVVAIVNTPVTAPLSLQELVNAALGRDGSTLDVSRELERSGTPRPFTMGQRVGDWLLQNTGGLSSGASPGSPPVVGGRVLVYPTIFYPATQTASKATVIAVGAGDERTGIDFQLRPVPTVRVAGTLTGPDGPERHTSLELSPVGADFQRDVDFAAGSTTTDETGAFLFLGIVPGNYVLRATKVPLRPASTVEQFTTIIQTGTTTISSGGGPSIPPPIPPDPTYWASMPVTVADGDVTGLAVVFRTGARVSGRIEFDGTAQKPPLDRLRQGGVQVDPADGRTTSATPFPIARGVIDAESQFKTYQLTPGRYIVRAPAFASWTFKGAYVNGKDVSDTPLTVAGDDITDVVITYTDRPSELIGTVHGERGPDPSATVLLVPADEALWTDYGPLPRRLRALRVDSGAVYKLTGLPAGEYLVVALQSELPANWQDVKFLKRLSPVATRVTIADGEHKTQDLSSKEVK